MIHHLDTADAAIFYQRFIRCGSAMPVANYKETDSPPQLDSDEAAMTYERFIRCGSASRWRTTTRQSAPLRRISTFGLAVGAACVLPTTVRPSGFWNDRGFYSTFR